MIVPKRFNFKEHIRTLSIISIENMCQTSKKIIYTFRSINFLDSVRDHMQNIVMIIANINRIHNPDPTNKSQFRSADLYLSYSESFLPFLTVLFFFVCKFRCYGSWCVDHVKTFNLKTKRQ